MSHNVFSNSGGILSSPGALLQLMQSKVDFSSLIVKGLSICCTESPLIWVDLNV